MITGNNQYIRFKKHVRQHCYGGGNPIKDCSNDPKVKRNLELYQKLIELSRGPNPNFDLIKQYYDPNIIVYTMDGKITKGYEEHEKGMRVMFQLAPDVKIDSTDLKFGCGDWIAVATTMIGTTITGPFSIPGQPTINLTGKKFNMKSCLLLRWENDKIVEFRNYWNQKEFEKQIGVSERPVAIL